MRKIIFFAILFVCAGFLVPAQNFTPSLQREFVIIESKNDYNLNPHTASYVNEAQLLSGIYEGLFSYHPYSLDAEPAIVESYRISRDRLTWTFTLRKDAKFSNGEAITAQTIRDSWILLLQPNTNAPFASLLDCIAGAEDFRTGKTKDSSVIGVSAVNEQTLQVKTNTPTEFLPTILCHHSFAAVHKDAGVSSGAFVIDSKTDSHIILRKNEHYWDKKNVAIPSVKIILSDDIEQNTYLFNTGSADWVTGDFDANHIFNTDALQLSPQFGTEFLFFKADTAPFDNTDFRNALINAIPWQDLRKSALIKASTLMLRLPEYPAIDGLEDQDTETAKKLLAKSGVKNAHVSIAMPDNPTAIAKAEVLKKAWQDLGIQVTIEKIPTENYLQNIKKTNANVFSYVWIGDYADPTAFLELFRGNSTLNESNYKNNTFDSLLNEAAKITDNKKRYEKLADAEQELLNSGVIMPISHTLSFTVIDTSVISGWYNNALNIHPFKYIQFIQPKPQSNFVYNFIFKGFDRRQKM